jgi:uncharacterized protein YbgA (DUF1722 family)/uncharacterized protein YbbK (DUF523 family)
LGFAPCRWNGAVIPDRFIERLAEHVELVTVCPESDIGLGVPRDPLRVVSKNGQDRLMQPNTGKDVSDAMRTFTRQFLDELGDVDGFILKDRSPSCGVKGVKAYHSMERGSSAGKTSGFFGGTVLERYPHVPVESEGRLMNYVLREHFLTGLFTGARFRMIHREPRMKDLVGFHAEHKFLLMAYNQDILHALGRITANSERLPVSEVYEQYAGGLAAAFARAPSYGAHINVLMHALGYFSDKLSSREKRFFLDSLEEYKTERLPLSVPIALVRSYIVRYQEEYLLRQRYFAPYPEDLVAITDSGKGRSFNR